MIVAVVITAIVFGFLLGRYAKEKDHDRNLKAKDEQIRVWKEIAEKRGPKIAQSPETVPLPTIPQPPGISWKDNK